LDKAYVQVETFRSAGLTREDIIDAIKPLIQHLKIDIDSLLRNKPNITEKPTKSLLQSMAAWLRKINFIRFYHSLILIKSNKLS
jgi:hypothetical protein